MPLSNEYGDKVVVVVLPQAPEDDPQKRYSCACKADELVTVGVWVVSHGCGGLSGGRGGKHAGRGHGGFGLVSGDAGVRSKHTDDTRSHRRPGAQLLVLSSWNWSILLGKALTQDATRRLRFVVHAAGCLHSMVLHGGKTQWHT